MSDILLLLGAKFQKFIDQAADNINNVKPMMFDAYRISGGVNPKSVITYQHFTVNTFGTAMDLSTGLFTAPKDGFYQFKGTV